MGFSFHFSSLYPAPYIELNVCYLIQISYLNFRAVLVLPKTASSAQTHILFLGTFRDSSGSFGLTPDGQIQKLPVKLKLHGDREVVKISSGADHLAMLTLAGELYTIGE